MHVLTTHSTSTWNLSTSVVPIEFKVFYSNLKCCYAVPSASQRCNAVHYRTTAASNQHRSASQTGMHAGQRPAFRFLGAVSPSGCAYRIKRQKGRGEFYEAPDIK